MPKNPEETVNYSPVLQSQEQRKIDLKLIEEGEKVLEEYREHLREAQAYLADPNISAKSRENVLKLVEQFTLRMQEKEEKLNAHKIRLGLEVNPPINPPPLSP